MSEQIISPPKAPTATLNMEGRPVKVLFEGVENLLQSSGTYVGMLPMGFLVLSNGLDCLSLIAIEHIRAIHQVPVQDNVTEITDAENVEVLNPDKVVADITPKDTPPEPA